MTDARIPDRAHIRCRRRVGLRSGMLVAAVCVALSGCTGFLYKRLDWLVVWYVNGVVTLDDAQEQEVRRIVTAGLDWHRTTQLPRYRVFLQDLDRDTDGPMTATLVERRYDEMVALWDVMLIRLADDAAPLLASLTLEQRQELFENLEHDNEEIWEEYAGSTPELRRARRSKTTMRVLQRFMGRLTDDQRVSVRAAVDGMHDVAEEWLERRRAWQARFREVLESGTAGAEFSAAMRDLALRPDQFDSVEYRRKVTENRQLIFRMLADLSGRMTTAQRDRMGRKLREYATDLDSLTRQD